MLFPIEKLLRRIITALAAVSIVLVAFGSGFPASHALAGVPLCAGTARADAGGEMTSSTEIKLSKTETKAVAGKLTDSGPSKQNNATASGGAACCGTYCAPVFSLSDRPSGMIFSHASEIWTAACDLLQPTEPGGSMRPPRTAPSQTSRA